MFYTDLYSGSNPVLCDEDYALKRKGNLISIDWVKSQSEMEKLYSLLLILITRLLQFIQSQGELF